MPSIESPNLNPKIFASYAWSDERSVMVREVCERLKADHVDVLLDQWHVKEGDDVYHFTEKSVNDPTVNAVLLFCDKLYTQKANSRTAGIGSKTLNFRASSRGKCFSTPSLPMMTAPSSWRRTSHCSPLIAHRVAEAAKPRWPRPRSTDVRPMRTPHKSALHMAQPSLR